MSVDLAVCEDYVADILNAARETFGTINFPLFKAEGITIAVRAAAVGIMAAILDTPGHRYRDLLLEQRALSDGELLKGAIGAILIDTQKGVMVKPSKLNRFKTNRANLTTIADGKYYNVEGHTVNFIGDEALAETLKNLDPADLAVPDEYEGAVIAGGAWFSFPKEGSNVQAAETFRTGYFQYLELIKGGATTIPAFNPFGQKV